ncbi:phosphatase PAP2 family protein [Tumebacillus sp. DT12]|uniref:Phosphatase PAP2 family protein n=1 Tax=Tumebacillus lacus TaxID=2995335 RepID=A0ABT3X5E4_9BACL|nr:phosphatase PAP2 family protein [Tumebacillus lacus]MCX7569929.1 phosphatase PAP2 family protein [Tumebacillus lacus]
MDKLLLNQIRRPIGRHHNLDRFILHIAKRGPLWFFLILGLLALQGAYLPVLAAILAATATRALNELLGRLYFRQRPFIQEGFEPLLPHAPTSSFPSNHAACGFALAVAVWLLLPPVGIPMLLLAALLALSRVYVGVHYPADILLGSLIGTAVAHLTVFLLQ